MYLSKKLRDASPLDIFFLAPMQQSTRTMRIRYFEREFENFGQIEKTKLHKRDQADGREGETTSRGAIQDLRNNIDEHSHIALICIQIANLAIRPRTTSHISDRKGSVALVWKVSLCRVS